MSTDSKVIGLQGPILILGGSGFIGANLLRRLLASRTDVVGTVFSGDSWRLSGIPAGHITYLNLQDPLSLTTVLQRVRPKTIFDCSSFGAYSFEEDAERIHATNYQSFIRIMEQVADYDLAAYVHAGSSSEYGLNAAGPAETETLIPNSHYAVSKAATSQAIAYYGKVRGLPIVNLRLYSIYGPYEDSSRLIPVLCEHTLRGELPTFARPEVSRDFVHVDDTVEAFLDAAIGMSNDVAGESFNIGSGEQTTLADLAGLAGRLFDIAQPPQFHAGAGRAWDVDNWYANPDKAKRVLGWSARIPLTTGLAQTQAWWRDYLAAAPLSATTKKRQQRKEKNSVSAVIACYKDGQAIPIMHQRLTAVFQAAGID